MSKAESIRIMIPYFWNQFKIYLNDPNYFIRQEDRLSDYFSKGEEDVKSFVESCNKFSKLHSLGLEFPYKPGLTYKDLLKQL